jgi:hypothetical protein
MSDDIKTTMDHLGVRTFPNQTFYMPPDPERARNLVKDLERQGENVRSLQARGFYAKIVPTVARIAGKPYLVGFDTEVHTDQPRCRCGEWIEDHEEQAEVVDAKGEHVLVHVECMAGDDLA